MIGACHGETADLSRPTLRIFLLVPTFQPHDAVGNDVLGMYRILREAGYDTAIYAEHVHADFAGITSKSRLGADDLWRDPAYLALRDRIQRFDFSPCAFCGGCDLSETNEQDCIGNASPTCGGCLWAQGIIQCP